MFYAYGDDRFLVTKIVRDIQKDSGHQLDVLVEDNYGKTNGIVTEFSTLKAEQQNSIIKFCLSNSASDYIFTDTSKIPNNSLISRLKDYLNIIAIPSKENKDEYVNYVIASIGKDLPKWIDYLAKEQISIENKEHFVSEAYKWNMLGYFNESQPLPDVVHHEASIPKIVFYTISGNIEEALYELNYLNNCEEFMNKVKDILNTCWTFKILQENNVKEFDIIPKLKISGKEYEEGYKKISYIKSKEEIREYCEQTLKIDGWISDNKIDKSYSPYLWVGEMINESKK